MEKKYAVVEIMQLELSQFGLIIYNTNVKQLEDIPGHGVLLPSESERRSRRYTEIGSQRYSSAHKIIKMSSQ